MTTARNAVVTGAVDLRLMMRARSANHGSVSTVACVGRIAAAKLNGGAQPPLVKVTIWAEPISRQTGCVTVIGQGEFGGGGADERSGDT